MNSRDQLPIIGITMGDPVGIGPEIIVKALAQPELKTICRPVIFGDHHVITHAMRSLGIEVPLQIHDTFQECTPGPQPSLINLSDIGPETLVHGSPTPESSSAMAEAIVKAVRHARDNGIKAGLLKLVTVWPVAEKQIRSVAGRVDTVLSVEMNIGKYAHEIERVCCGYCKVGRVTKNRGMIHTTTEIYRALEEAAK